MRIIVAGSREGFTISSVERAMEAALKQWKWLPCDVTVVSGTARGVDTLGEQWAYERNLPVERYPADWAQWGKSAGYRRNAQMAENADALVALWDGESRGTGHMIAIAHAKGLPIYVHGPGKVAYELAYEKP